MDTHQLTATVAGLLVGTLSAGVLATSLAADGAPARVGAGPDPADFADPRRNAYFPLEPGHVTRLRGSDQGERLRQIVRVTHRTKSIQGVETTVVLDIVKRPDGSVAERTHDWYAADNDGNVWYFGERTATYDEHGQLESREGSWQAGVDGARAGILITADPRATDATRQEYYRGHAEDQAWVVQNNVRVTVPAGRFRDVVRTFEWTRPEKQVVGTKLYARGVGIILERDVAGGQERLVLTSVRRP